MFSKIKRGGRHVIGVAITVLWLLPLWWVIVASLREPGLAPLSTVEWWPANPSWGNYRAVFEIAPMARYTLNSLIVAAIAAPATLLTASLAGFSISQLPDTPRQRLVLTSIALLMIPAASVWLFRFQILRWLGLIDSLAALILPAFAASNPLFVLLFYWAFRSIPTELFEAARLDGADAWTNWWAVGIPLSIPTSACVLVLAFVMYWSDFVNPVLYIFDPAKYTLPVGLQILNQLDATNWPLLMAGAMVMAAPVIVLFAVLQRLFLHDLSPANLWSKN